MNIYKLEYNHGKEQYIVAESYREAEELWEDGPDRYKADRITLIFEDVMISDKLKL